jgi:hypothetical protein
LGEQTPVPITADHLAGTLFSEYPRQRPLATADIENAIPALEFEPRERRTAVGPHPPTGLPQVLGVELPHRP